MQSTQAWGSIEGFREEREARRKRRVAVVASQPAKVIAFPGADLRPVNPLFEIFEAMSGEARVDLLAYARGRLRRDRR
jgi:hypothetical protein